MAAVRKHISLFAVCVFLVQVAVAQKKDQCLTCHEALGDKPTLLFAKDIHAKKGLSCADCHGGNRNSEDIEVAMDKSRGFLGVPKGDDISKMCASCHSNGERMKNYGSRIATNQWETLLTSVHGKLSTTGKDHIAQCTTCHNAHGIAGVNNPSSPVSSLNVTKTCARCHSSAEFMRNYNPSLPVDQLEKYRTSVHGVKNARGDARTAECASCHGSHDIRSANDAKSKVHAQNLPSTCARCHADAGYMKGYKIPTDQYAKFTKSVHGVALLQKRDLAAPACNDCHGNHGAIPPGVESISKVCGTCHALNADLFSSSPHKKAFDERKLPECETCHGNHEIIAVTDKLLGIGPDAVCSKCHSKTENEKGFTAAQNMRALVDSLEFSKTHATALIAESEQKGMEVSEARFKLREVHQARLESRTMVHGFNEQRFREVVEKGMKTAAAVSQEGENALEEYVYRRMGLGVSTLIITILAVSLYLFIRRLERRQQEATRL